MDSGLQVQLEEDGGRAGWRQVAYAAVGVTRHNSSQMENVTRVVYGYPTFCTFFVIPYCNIWRLMPLNSFLFASVPLFRNFSVALSKKQLSTDFMLLCWVAPGRSPSTFSGAFSISKGMPPVITLYWQVGETADTYHHRHHRGAAVCSMCCTTVDKNAITFFFIMWHVYQNFAYCGISIFFIFVIS